jgi:aryl-alcohol dehydrogenase-like predicted oxidoreductase
MRYNKLGQSDVDVSVICLGTMTFGEQNTEKEGHEQLDYAISQGVNFIDTAELYSVPATPDTYGATERIIGSWLAKRGKRDDVVLASKIAGPGITPGWVEHIRNGETRYNTKDIEQALDGSLKRLQTDYIDLYQLHWPERKTNFFGKLGYEAQEDTFTPVKETLAALAKHVEAGKIRYIGLSNETPWGMMTFINIAKQYDLPVIASNQNPYSLLNRTYEIGCAEISYREKVGLLAYSPLGFGVLTGKYLNEALPSGSRLSLWPQFARYSNPRAVQATQAYVDLAKKYGLNPAQMALAYVNSRPFLTANIIGATSIQQLKTNISSVDVVLPIDIIDEIELVHSDAPNPSP